MTDSTNRTFTRNSIRKTVAKTHDSLAETIVRRMAYNGTRLRLFYHSVRLDSNGEQFELDRVSTLPSVAILSHSFDRIVFRCHNEKQANRLFDKIRSTIRAGISSRGILMQLGQAFLYNDPDLIDDDIEPTLDQLFELEAFAE